MRAALAEVRGRLGEGGASRRAARERWRRCCAAGGGGVERRCRPLPLALPARATPAGRCWPRPASSSTPRPRRRSSALIKPIFGEVLLAGDSRCSAASGHRLGRPDGRPERSGRADGRSADLQEAAQPRAADRQQLRVAEAAPGRRPRQRRLLRARSSSCVVFLLRCLADFVSRLRLPAHRPRRDDRHPQRPLPPASSSSRAASTPSTRRASWWRG